jgi:hypothetical protein
MIFDVPRIPPPAYGAGDMIASSIGTSGVGIVVKLPRVSHSCPVAVREGVGTAGVWESVPRDRSTRERP